jgi:hypothetical protein
MEPRTRREPPERFAAPAGHVFVTGIVCLGLATLLNAASLLETAERQPIGSTTRQLAVGIMEPVAEISEVLLLDRPREALEQTLGREPDPAALPEANPEPVVLRSEESTTRSTLPGESTTTTTTTTVPAPALRVVGEDDPLRLWAIGDSFVELFGPALGNDAAETDVVVPEYDFRFISGLIRDDYFDWPAHLAQRLPEVRPDAVVVMFGGNDGQPIPIDGVLREPEEPEWLELYHDRVGGLMDVLLTGTSRVYWLGLPIMRDDRFTERVLMFNEVYREEAEARPAVTYVDTFELFQDENGEYSTYLRTDSGDLLEMRTPDGAHFSWNGAYRLSEHVLEIIGEDWGFADRL